ncbi:Hint domain-containing protein [Paracoccus marcusii]|uniref:Hint domain-containing protein n=1 Tax=Paracoccus marcusii TaxID=59779 RepID=UPI001FCC7E17|nr:Hint domain-containing protein [Paracoccus marcusii]
MPFVTTLPDNFVTVNAGTPVLNTNAQSVLNTAIGDVEQTTFIRGDDSNEIATSGETLTFGVGDDVLTGEYVGPVTFSNLNPSLALPGLAAINLQLNPIEGHVVRVGGTNYFISDDDPTPDNLLVTMSITVAGQTVSATVPASDGIEALSDALRARATELPGIENTATRLALNTAATTVDTLAPTTAPLVNTITVNVAEGDGILDVAPVCFVRGTLIETVNGLQPIETLKVGDMVMTRDHGLQPIRWIGCRALSPMRLVLNAKLRPIRIRAGALGRQMPANDLLVSPQHRILVRSAIAQKMFGTEEILAAAKQLVMIDGIDICNEIVGLVEYFHMLLDQHEIVYANGAEAESLLPGPEALKSVGPDALDEIYELFPELSDAGFVPSQARTLATGRMARRLAVRHAQNGKALVAHS